MVPVREGAKRSEVMNDTERGSEPPAIGADEARSLIAIARDSIRHGIETGEPLDVTGSDSFTEGLSRHGASFVTLNLEGSLRGCIGSIEARRPLVQDVALNAFAAAFRDPRFPPLSADELERIELHVSLLAPTQPLEVTNEDELLAALRPGIDGLILEDPPYRSVFLPQVWESLPEPAEFVAHLKRKAGLPASHWSAGLRFYRFTVDALAE